MEYSLYDYIVWTFQGRKWEIFKFSIYVVLKGGWMWESSLVLISEQA